MIYMCVHGEKYAFKIPIKYGEKLRLCPPWKGEMTEVSFELKPQWKVKIVS